MRKVHNYRDKPGPFCHDRVGKTQIDRLRLAWQRLGQKRRTAVAQAQISCNLGVHFPENHQDRCQGPAHSCNKSGHHCNPVF